MRVDLRLQSADFCLLKRLLFEIQPFKLTFQLRGHGVELAVELPELCVRCFGCDDIAALAVFHAAVRVEQDLHRAVDAAVEDQRNQQNQRNAQQRDARDGPAEHRHGAQWPQRSRLGGQNERVAVAVERILPPAACRTFLGCSHGQLDAVNAHAGD